MRLLQHRLDYMKDPFLEEECSRADKGKSKYTFTDFVARLERRVQTLSQMGKPSASARVAAFDTTTTAPNRTYANSAANPTARIAATLFSSFLFLYCRSRSFNYIKYI